MQISVRAIRSQTRWNRPALAVMLAIATTLSFGLPAEGEAQLKVSPNTNLNPEGQTVTATGRGYDEAKGIYVAWCVVPPAGEKPGPCGGGADTEGSSQNSVWISSNPPMYGLGLAEQYDEGGSFEVELGVSRYIETDDVVIDCFETPCAVVTRNDHERTDDRSQDVFVPIRFTGQPAPNAGAADATSESDEPTASPSPTRASPTPTPPAERTESPSTESQSTESRSTESQSTESRSNTTSTDSETVAGAPDNGTTGQPDATVTAPASESPSVTPSEPTRAYTPSTPVADGTNDDSSAMTSVTVADDRGGPGQALRLVAIGIMSIAGLAVLRAYRRSR
jgi:hypothetical protein